MKLIITVLIIGILSGAEIDLFIPSLPEIQKQFQISPFETQLIISLNFISYCICSLIAGSFSDKYDRKSVILYSLLVFIFGSFLCCTAPYYWIILLGRVLQGIGIAGPSVLGYVVIADKYPPEKQSTFIGWIHGAIAVTMSVAPVFGSYIAYYFGWKGNFTALLILGILCLIMTILFIPSIKNTASSNSHSKSYIPLFQSTKLIVFILTLSLFMTPYWVFIGLSPILYMNGLNVSLEDFGFYQGALACVFGISSGLSGIVIKKMGLIKSMSLGIGICLIHVLSISWIVIMDIKDPLIITSCMAIASAAVVIPINILYPHALEIIQGTKGRTSALISSLRLFISSIGLFIVGAAYNGTFKPIGSWVIITISLALLLSMYLMKTARELKSYH